MLRNCSSSLAPFPMKAQMLHPRFSEAFSMKVRGWIRSQLSALAAALFLFCPLFSYAQARPQITQAVNTAQRKLLPGSVRKLPSTATDMGTVSGSLAMKNILLMLQPSAAQQAALREYLQELNNPNSPNYHKWLTPAQYAAQFGVDDTDIQTISGWLQSEGFNVDAVSAGKNWIRFSGTASQVQSAFQTQVHQFSWNGSAHYANTTAASIPSALAPAVQGVVSLNNFISRPEHTTPVQLSRNTQGKLVPAVDTNIAVKGGSSSPSFTSAGSQVENFLTPGDFSTIYDTQSLIASGTDGSGVSIAVVGRSDISLSDIEAFRTIFGLPFNDPNVIYATTDPGDVSGDDVEASLDTEWAGAIAPKAKINYIVGASTNTTDGVDLAAAYAVNNAVSPILTVSFGLCEADMSDAQIAFYQILWEQAAAEGITVLVSSGDAGASGCNAPTNASTVYGFGVNGLASTPYNVAVGGTEFSDTDTNTYWNLDNSATLSSAKGYIPEAAWNESCAGALDPSATNCAFPPYYIYSYAGGGGASSCATRTTDQYGDEYCAGGYTKPDWQTGTGVPQDGVRDLPDVSLAAASEHDGYFVCYQGSCQWTQNADGSITLDSASVVGGTSAASPSMAAIMALVEQAHGQYLGVVNYEMYKLAAQSGATCDASQRNDPTQSASCIFNDVTQGSNAVPCFSGNQDCQGTDQPVQVGVSLPAAIFPPDSFTDGQATTTGYDLATGLGSVNAANLVKAWGTLSTAASNTTLKVSQTTFQHGTSITLSGSVTAASGSGTPSGQVLVTASSTGGGVASETLSSGAYSGSTIDLPGGTYDLVATYSGDETFGSSKSAPVSVTVSPEDSTLTGTSYAYSRFYILGRRPVVQLSATQFGMTFWLQVQVQGASGSEAATGSISLAVGGKTFGTYPVSKEGKIYVQCGPETECDFAPGSYTITASYSGDGSFNASTTTFPFTVTKGSATWETRANNTTPVANSQVIGYVYFSGDPATPPSGTVTLTRDDTGAVLGTATIDKTGTATVPFIAPSGSYFLDASYSGDDNYSPGYQVSSQQIVTTDNGGTKKDTVAFALGQHTQATVTVTPAQGETGTPIGYVTLYSSSGPISGQMELAGGHASGVVEWDSVGSQPVYVVYGGDGKFAGGSSPMTTVTVAQGVPAVTVQPEAGYVAVGGQASVTALLSSSLVSTSAPAPTGSIQFYDSVNGGTAKAIGTAQMVTNGNGGTLVATLAPTLPQGANVITAVYSGDANWKSATSAASTPIEVTTPDYTATTSASSLTVAAGETASIPVSTQSILGYNSPVSLSCGGTLPEGVTCNTVQITPGSTGTVTLTTVAPGTNSTTTAMAHGWLWPVSGTVSFAGLFLLFLPNRRRLSNLAMVLVACGFIGLIAGCGGNSVGNTQMSISSSNTKVASGSSLTLQATILATHKLKGTVAFFDGNSQIGDAVIPVNGVATVQTSSLAVGTHAITAKYSGDSDNSASTSSNTLEQTVTGSFNLTVNAASGSITHTLTIPVTLQ